MQILPKQSREHGWAPYVWLAYFAFFFAHPIFDHVGWKEWVATIVGAIVFLILYFGNFSWPRPWNHLGIGGLVVLGLAFVPYNGGAVSFFIYACAFVPFHVEKLRNAILALLLIPAVAATEGFLLKVPRASVAVTVAFCLIVGIGNILFAQHARANRQLRRAHEEIEQLAKVAERERIARDMHDILGHTLSVIILKSELAGKLISIDPERAKNEIRDVEQTSRQALADVRNAIRGYRAQSLDAELKQAKATLETAGVTVSSETSQVTLSPTQESVVALVVREAITNVVRHANASNCLLRMTPVNGSCRLEIQDDGRGGASIEGNGLRGMRERVQALGGTLERDTSKGTRLTIQFPLAAAKAGNS